MNTSHINQHSLVVGVDVHKYSHTAVALDPWGKERGMLDFSNDNLPVFTSWVSSLGEQENTIVALEDVNCYGVHMVRALVSGGFHIRYVPAILTERERKCSTKREKSDAVDAKRVAKVMLTKYEETLPARESIAGKEELLTAQSLDLLLTERRDLVRLKTILKNQLHGLLHQHYGDHYADAFKKPFNKEAVAFYESDLSILDVPNERSILAAAILRRLKRLSFVEGQITDISKGIKDVGEGSLAVMALSEELHGCGMVTAASIVAELTTIRRFSTRDHLASYAGVAPTEHSSGRKERLHTNPFGNRRLNAAFHTIALSQIAIKGDPRGREYYARKVKEGKTKLWALRCLKRQIANRVFRILSNVTKEPPLT